ncbi:MAG: Oxidoreductase, FAD-binding protein [Conexibacter sp.]|nr:Oxidoreductase, FAD-binding protein [Conexibacter sp.]
MTVWHNHTGNQSSPVIAEAQPRTLDELVAIVRDAEARGVTVRAVGAGHAWSDVALTTGVVVLPTHLGGLVELDDGTLRAGSTGAGDPPLVRVLGGTHIRDLNDALRARGLALPNMGGYDAQTIAGVVSTSTHGSGLTFGPFPELVRSLELVVSGGELVRVEPADGITDPAAFAAARGDGWTLVQDDDVFAAAVCGMGTLGLVYALVLEVRDVFWLDEVREVVGWEAIRDTVTPGGVLAQHEHYELFLNPYKNKDGTHHVLVTTREPCDEPPDGESPGRGLQHPLTELASGLPITGWGLRLLARHLPRLMVKRFDQTLHDMQDKAGYHSISYKVFNIGEANKLPAYSMELGVTLEGDRHLEAVDLLLAMAARWADDGVFHTSPIALRFVAPSKAYASMMYGRPTMMIELIMVVDSHRGEELLAAYERELAALGARPHWGQINALTPARVRELYPRWDAWLEVERRFNASGVFDAPFTRRLGISV